MPKHTIALPAAALLLSSCQTPLWNGPGPSKVRVSLDPGCIRSIGGVTRFRREQFITIHAAPTDHDMNDADWDLLLNELGVCFGREGGGRTWRRRQTPADPQRPGFPDVAHIRRYGAEARKERRGDPVQKPERWREMISCTHPESYCPWSKKKDAPWGPSSMESAAEFTAHYLKETFTDEDRPRYLEVLNEPMVKLKKIGGTPTDVAKLHVAVARRVRELCPNVLVGGYTAAYPEVEIRDFSHWNSWMKTFMDVAGADMDFFSTHIYDGVNVEGTPRRRTGSNSEALIDIIDAYSHISFGVAKPQIISEFGLIPKNSKDNKGHPYDPAVIGEMIHAATAQLMTFMDHPDRLTKVVPFILTKAHWTYNLPGCSEENPYPFLLWRKRGDGHELTHLALYYRFWQGVNGEWRASSSSDPDIRCHLLVDGKRLFVILCNLENASRTVVLDGLSDVAADRIALRRLTTRGVEPTLAETPLEAVPEPLQLAAGESAMLIIDSAAPVAPERQVRETRCYATTYLQDIVADTPITFDFRDVPTGRGTAVLRLGIGREQGTSRTPVVRVAGRRLAVPADWAGGDQSGRKNFFGVIEIPVPMELVTAVAAVEVIFPDSGGKVASAILQVNRLAP